MEIIDLTQGKYDPWLANCYQEYKGIFENKLWAAAVFSSDFRLTLDKPISDIKDLFNGVPVYLVEKSMSMKYVDIPDCDMKIYVPDDKKRIPNGIDFENDSKNHKKDSLIIDILGLYVHKNIKPSHIFIWVDKIQKKAEEYVKKHSNCI